MKFSSLAQGHTSDGSRNGMQESGSRPTLLATVLCYLRHGIRRGKGQTLAASPVDRPKVTLTELTEFTSVGLSEEWILDDVYPITFQEPIFPHHICTKTKGLPLSIGLFLLPHTPLT